MDSKTESVKSIESRADNQTFEQIYLPFILKRYYPTFDDYSDEKKSELIKESLSNNEITKQLRFFEDAVTKNISLCSEKLQASIQNAMTAYYKLLSKDSHNSESLASMTNLSTEELEVLKAIDSFDIESLNLYKNLSEEEKAIMKLAGLKW